MSDVETAVREVLREHAYLPVDVDTLRDDADLYRAGMTSHATIGVMLALEQSLDIEFTTELLQRDVFASIANISEAVRSLGSPSP